MRAQRIKTGFHRLGLALAIVCGVPGMIGLGLWMLTPTDPLQDVLGPPPNSNGIDPRVALTVGTLGLIGAATAYVISRTIGWIVAGFAGDENSN